MDNVQLYNGDCLEVLKTLAPGSVDAVVTDPPYGVKQLTNYSRFTGGSVSAEYRKDHAPIHGDDREFDPSPWLQFPKALLFGFNSYSNKLPRGSVVVWCKRRDSRIGKFLSDCELAWMKGGYGVYLFHHEWDGVIRESERGKFHHPSQKPVALMAWVLDKMKIPVGATVIDPYMGSGTTGVACVQTGRKFIGVEIDPNYFAVAEKRIAEATANLECVGV